MEEEKKRREEEKKKKEEEKLEEERQKEEEKFRQEMRREAFNEDEQLKELGKSMEIFQEWSGHMDCTIIFDSDKDDSETNECFNEKIYMKEKCFFINFDKKGNIFGAYIKEFIGLFDEDIDDEKHFIFTLQKENVNDVKRWFIKSGMEGGIKVFTNNDCLYQIGNDTLGCFGISKLNLRRNVCINLSKQYEGMSDIDLCGSNLKFFSMQRIVVIQMN